MWEKDRLVHAILDFWLNFKCNATKECDEEISHLNETYTSGVCDIHYVARNKPREYSTSCLKLRDSLCDSITEAELKNQEIQSTLSIIKSYQKSNPFCFDNIKSPVSPEDLEKSLSTMVNSFFGVYYKGENNTYRPKSLVEFWEVLGSLIKDLENLKSCIINTYAPIIFGIQNNQIFSEIEESTKNHNSIENTQNDANLKISVFDKKFEVKYAQVLPAKELSEEDLRGISDYRKYTSGQVERRWARRLLLEWIVTILLILAMWYVFAQHVYQPPSHDFEFENIEKVVENVTEYVEAEEIAEVDQISEYVESEDVDKYTLIDSDPYDIYVTPQYIVKDSYTTPSNGYEYLHSLFETKTLVLPSYDFLHKVIGMSLYTYNELAVNFENNGGFEFSEDPPSDIVIKIFSGWINNWVYIGQLNLKGDPEGLGIKVKSSGKMYQGHFLNGYFNGTGRFFRGPSD